MMKKYIPYVLILVVGFVIGTLCRPNHFRDTTKISQNDTIVRLDTIKYSRFELVRNTYKLDIPKISRPELVYIPADSATIIYRDSVRYVTLQRQYFYTSTDDVEIWHSGIDSTIDSLNVVRKTQEITKVSQTVTNRNALRVGVEVSYMTDLSIPVYLEYGRMLNDNIEVYGRVMRDMRLDMTGASIGTRIQFGW